MGSRYEVEVTVGSATNLKNVNWRNGELRPYAVLWVDDGPKCSTRVDLDNGDNPVWDDKLTVPIPATTRLDDAVLHVDVVHAANAAEEAEGAVKPLVGSARLPLRDVLDDAGVGAKVSRTLTLKRPSGRRQGRLDLRVAVREPARYYEPPYPSSYPAPAAYGAAGSRDPYYAGQPGYGQPPPPYAAPPSGYPANAYGAPPAYGAAPPPPAYGADPAAAYGASTAAPPAYGAAPPPPAYGAAPPAAPQKSKMGMGAGLAMGAAAGVLGGLALAEGASYLEDKFEDHVAEKVEEDLYDGGDDDY